MTVDWCWIYNEAKGWQTGIGALAGFGAIVVGALYNARLNRKRDERDECIAIASALYGEIVILRRALAGMANAVGHRFMAHGIGQLRGEQFDRHFVDRMKLPHLKRHRLSCLDFRKMHSGRSLIA